MTDDRHDETSRTARGLAQMTQAAFVEGWRALVGEPPAIMLDDRRDMISILVETIDMALVDGPCAASRGRAAARARLPRRAG